MATPKKSAKAKSTRTRSGSKELTELAEKMRGIDLCMLTTIAEDGALHARPMSNNGEVDFDGDAWFFSSRETLKIREIEADNRVQISYVGGTKKEPIWISLSGSAVFTDDVAKKKALWVKELDRWFPEGPEDPGVVLIHVSAERVSWWSYEGEGSIDLTA